MNRRIRESLTGDFLGQGHRIAREEEDGRYQAVIEEGMDKRWGLFMLCVEGVIEEWHIDDQLNLVVRLMR